MAGFDYLQAMFFLKCIAFLIKTISQRREHGRRVRLARIRSSAKRRMQLYRMFKARKSRALISTVLMMNSFKPSAERKVWCKVRSENWWHMIVKGNFEEDEWIQNFRMSKGTFESLCKEVHPFMYKQDTQMRKAIPVDKRVAVALWRLATNCDYRTIGHLFGIAKSTVCEIVAEFCFVINRYFMSKYISIPTDEDLCRNVSKFDLKWGFPSALLLLMVLTYQ